MIAAVVAGLALAGCNQSGRPTGGAVPVRAAYPSSIAVTPAAGEGMRNYTVVTGDTVYGVAGRFDVPIRTLIEVNRLTAPFRLRPGQRLAVPARREHVVKPGQTVQSIARIYGVDQSTLIRVNDIPPPYLVRAGQRLRLPAPVETASPTARPTEPVPAPAGTMMVEDLGPAAPAPASGPVPDQVTATPPAAPAALADRTASPPTVPQTAAMPLPVPQTGPVPLPLPPPPMPAQETPATPDSAAPEPEPSVAPEAGPTALVVPAKPPEPIPAAIPQPPPLSGGKFLWPVSGRIVSRFGPKDGGLHNDGINIAAPRGTPVRAAESGVVAYAGNELRGFGKLLLIRHADGWMSAYAHNDALLVERGDEVTRGQTIARVGSSGNVSTPQLHFELRRGTRTVDPLEHLGAQGASLTPEAARDDPPDLG